MSVSRQHLDNFKLFAVNFEVNYIVRFKLSKLYKSVTFNNNKFFIF